MVVSGKVRVAARAMGRLAVFLVKVPGVAVVVAVLMAGLPSAAGQSAGSWADPGLPALTYRADELFKPLGTFHSPAGTSWGNGTFFRGYLVLGIDVNEDSSGFQFWDISDPRKPRMAYQKYDAESRRLREIQGYSFGVGYGKDFVAIPSHAGIEIWDFSDVASIKRAGAVALAQGGGKGIYNGVISAAWQPPYIYCGAMNNGLFVVDARDPKAPKLVKRIPNSALGGRLVGPVFAMGNLLVATTMEDMYQACAISTFDISDPADPQLIDLYQCATREGSYTAFMSGNRIYGQGVDGLLLVYELTPRFEVNKIGEATARVARGGYGMYQDGYVHSGMSDWYIKYDARTPNPVEIGRFNVLGDNDWVIPMGNIAFVGDDDGPGSAAALVPHQSGLDTIAPKVSFSVPAAGATGLVLGSRVGLSFTDLIDQASVDSASFLVRPVGGKGVSGKFSVLMGVVNFTPDSPLAPTTEYEVFLQSGALKGGLKDWAGNVVKDTSIRFTTGASVPVRRQAPRQSDLRKLRLLVPGCSDGRLGSPLPADLRDPLGREARPGVPPLPARPSRLTPGLYLAPAGGK